MYMAHFRAKIFSSIRSERQKPLCVRDSVIAHSLIHAEPEAQTYEQLFRLVAIATRLTTAAEHASTAGGGHFADFRQDRRAKSEEFWAIFIRGAKP